MKALNGRLTRIDPGCVHIELPYSDVVTQQHKYFHAAAIAAIAEVTVSAVVDEQSPGRVREAPRVRVAMMLQTNCRVKSSHEYHRPR